MAERTPAKGDHPDARTLAAHVERRLPAAEASRVDEHLAACPSCYEVFAEAAQFRLEEDAEEEATAPAGAFVSSRPSRPRAVARAAALLALAAAVALASWAAWRTQQRPAASALVADLVRAVGESRFVEPRLTGGFHYARLVRLRSGGGRGGLDAQPPSVIAAVARIRERAEANPSPDALAALGVTYLVSGDANAAVEALESAAAQAPQDARIQSDLAAAYLTRASRLDEPADLPRGLEAAEKALALSGAPDEARFNRALALEGLYLVDEARKAWDDYLKRDSTSPWADEARRRLADLPPPRRSSVEEDRARVRDALAQGAASLERLTDEAPAVVRAYFDERLLPAWAEAQLALSGDTRVLAKQAALVGEALLRRTADALPRDAAAALHAPAAVSGRDPPRLQALGFRFFAEARRRDEGLRPACEAFREARRLLALGGSPYAEAARERVAAKCLYPSQVDSARAELASLETDAERHAHVLLLARTRWLQGLIATTQGDLTLALERYRLALEAFVALGDAQNEAFVHALLAEVFNAIGDGRRAWGERRAALALLDRVRDPRRIHGILEEAALACLDAGLPRAALGLLTALAESGVAGTSPVVLCDALTRRGSVRLALDDNALAAADLSDARFLLSRFEDRALSERMEAELEATEGALLARTRPEEAEGALQRALDYFVRVQPVRVPALRLQLARVLRARGRFESAEAELLAGIRLVEEQRLSLRDVALQASFFEQDLPLFDDMVALQLDARHDPAAALAFVERGRGRQLADALADAAPSESPGRSSAAAAPLDAAALQRGLPEGVALVYYACVGGRLLAWRVTRDDLRFVAPPVSEAELSRLVAVQRASLERRAPLAAVRRAGERLYDVLVRPLELADSVRALVILPDAALHSVSFAALWNRETGRSLIEDVEIGLSPSGTFLLRHLDDARPLPKDPRALVVGNPRVRGRPGAGGDALPTAEREAEEIAGFYRSPELLTGEAATKAAFLDGLSRSDVVHYAGHAVAEAGDPAGSRLLLAADPSTGDTGALLLRDLPWRGLRPRLVVLAACRSAGGAVTRTEGALSLSRPFLAAGVPNVVGSLWDVDDEASRTFFVEFHRMLPAAGEPSAALRATQLSLLRGGSSALAHPSAWAGFVSIGALHSPSR